MLRRTILHCESRFREYALFLFAVAFSILGELTMLSTPCHQVLTSNPQLSPNLADRVSPALLSSSSYPYTHLILQASHALESRTEGTSPHALGDVPSQNETVRHYHATISNRVALLTSSCIETECPGAFEKELFGGHFDN